MITLYGLVMQHHDVSIDIKTRVHNWYIQSKILSKVLHNSNGTTVFFEGSKKTSSFDYMFKDVLKDIEFWQDLNLPDVQLVIPQEFENIKKETLKLGINILGIKKALNLNYIPPTFVASATYKSLTIIMNSLGLNRNNPSDFERIWLYDDKAEEHFQKMKQDRNPTYPHSADKIARSALLAHLIPVEKYNSMYMPLDNRAIISRNLNMIIPEPKLFFMCFPNLLKEISNVDHSWPAYRLQFVKGDSVSEFGENGHFEVGAGSLKPHVWDSPSWMTRMFNPILHG